jgi:anti-anti-sigma factor
MSNLCLTSVSVADSASVHVAVAGDLDLWATADVVEALQPHLGASVTIDLSAVTFIDAAGLGCLLRLQEQAEAAAGTVRLGPLSRPVERLLALTRLHDMMVATQVNDGTVPCSRPSLDAPHPTTPG